MSTLAASFLTGLVTALLAAAGTRYTTRRQLQVQYDADLRRLRIGAYRDLWKRLDALAKYGRTRTLARDEAHALGRSLRAWYFEVGGIFLSEQTRGDYFALQDAIEHLATPGSTRDPLTTADDDFLRVLGSRLRTGMTRDVGTRQTFMFKGDATAARAPRRARYRERDGHRRLLLAPASRSGGRRSRWWRGPRSLAATIDVQPSGQPERARWSRDRSGFVLGSGDGSRVFLLEGDGELIEGPLGWNRHAGATGEPPTVWLPDDSGESHQGA